MTSHIFKPPTHTRNTPIPQVFSDVSPSYILTTLVIFMFSRNTVVGNLHESLSL